MKKNTLSERFWIKVFKSFVWLDELRETHPQRFWFIGRAIVAACMYLLSLNIKFQSIPDPGFWPPAISSIGFSASNVISAIVGLAVGFFVAIPATRALLPMLVFVPQSIAMKELGLFRVTTDPVESINLIADCAKRHDRRQKVRIICISGRHLFRESQLAVSGIQLGVPLHDLGLMGLLEVIMPRSDPSNDTIVERHATYTQEYCEEHRIKTVNDFVAEIQAGKEFLMQNKRNMVSEHNILCCWRIMLFSDRCAVQTYFPNPTKSHSYESPTFVYQKRPDPGERTYYTVYEKMYEMVKKRSVVIAGGS